MEYGYASPLGTLTLTCDGAALTGLRFSGAPSPVRTGTEPPAVMQAFRWLDRYFGGEDPGQPPPLQLEGTAFQRAVWALLEEIPYGETVSYGQLAARVASRLGRSVMSAQAVGGAVGRNPVALIVPCHRVVGADGSLTGYAGGLDRKAFLLRLEAAQTKPTR